MSERGTDHVTEQRKAGPRAARKMGIERWVENVFYAGSEVVLLGFPALWGVMDAPNNVEVKFAALVAVVTLVLAIGTVRDGRIAALEWPALTPTVFVLKAVFHSVVITVAAYGGAALELFVGSPLGSLLFVVCCSGVAVWLFPRLVARVRELPAWWTWGQ